MQVGDRFGRLTVFELVSARNPLAKCLCDCGRETLTQRGSLRNGRAKSCGCLGAEKRQGAATKHGLSGTPEYKAFTAMKQRCENPNEKQYADYGGRGIKVTYKDFEEFLQDVGPRPHAAWIDREHNDRGYEPGNCRWVTVSVNQSNKRTSRFWMIHGITYESSREAANALGIDPSLVNRRCNGYQKGGRFYAPMDGWSSCLKYTARK